jgi:hypothetical protein
MISDLTPEIADAFTAQTYMSLPISGVDTIQFSGQSPASGEADPVDPSILGINSSSPVTMPLFYIGILVAAVYYFEKRKKHRR